MIDKDRKEFIQLVTDIHSFYRKDLSVFSGRVWWEALKVFDFSAVSEAFNRWCVNPDRGQFMPFPADVVRMLEGSTQDSALSAWAKVDRGVRTVGVYQSVVFDDPLIHRVLTEMGGWIQLGTKNDDEWPFLKNEFVNRYRGYRERHEAPEFPPVLLGIAESNNERAGFKSAAPMLIGDAGKAEQVLALGSTAQVVPIQQLGQGMPGPLRITKR